MGRTRPNYSVDLKMKIVSAYMNDGIGYRKLSEHFDVPVPSVATIIQVCE